MLQTKLIPYNKNTQQLWYGKKKSAIFGAISFVQRSYYLGRNRNQPIVAPTNSWRLFKYGILFKFVIRTLVLVRRWINFMLSNKKVTSTKKKTKKLFSLKPVQRQTSNIIEVYSKTLITVSSRSKLIFLFLAP